MAAAADSVDHLVDKYLPAAVYLPELKISITLTQLGRSPT